MTKFIAHSAVGDESKHNSHWKTQYYQCGICTIDYDFITQLEHAKEETRWILDFLDLTGTALIPVTILYGPYYIVYWMGLDGR